MGWLWASPPSKGAGNNSSGSTTTTTTTTTPKSSEPTPNSSSSNTNNTTTTTTKPAAAATDPSSNDYTDPELAKFLSQIQAEFSSSPPSSSSSSSSPSSSTTWPDPTSPQSSPPQLLDPVGESLLPTRMSCAQAFDLAYACNSLGGQFTAVYRDGGMRSCSAGWDQFWFCMRSRAYAAPQRERAVREFYRRRELARYGPGRPSSADVWDPRPEKLAPGEAFAETYEMPAVSDDEWRRAEMWRRRVIREGLEAEEEERRLKARAQAQAQG